MTAPGIESVHSLVPASLWERAAAAPRRAVLIDYDGTLAPYQVVRDRALPLPAALEALTRVAASRKTAVYVVSGRPVLELKRLLGQRPLRLVGEHGWEEWSIDGGLRLHAAPESVTRGIARSAEAASRLGFAARLEIKRCSVVLHTRGLPEVEACAAEEACRGPWTAEAESAGLRLDRVNGGLELRASERNKGTAVREILARLATATFPVYLGDDQTDEDAFREVATAGFGLRVGSSERPTLALGRLLSCQAVAWFLEQWWRVIEGGTPSEEERSA